MLKSILACLVVAVLWPAAAMGITDEEVSKAIDDMKKWLYSQQGQDGGWDAGVAGHEASQATGRSALVLHALLSAGESEHHPNIRKGLNYLKENKSDGTYAVGLRAHVFAELPKDRFGEFLQAEADWLMRAHKGSLFDYGSYRGERIDHSVTQYGILGLWEYAKANHGGVDAQFWKNAAEHFISAQKPDGGWDYNTQGGSTGSMTTAGLTVLYIAQQQALRTLDKPNPEITAAIERGLAYLQKNFNGGTNPGGGWNFYYLYGIERVALASGIKMLNNQDWFEAGATYILARKQANGSIGGSVVDTAFALGFLARGRVPVWVNKLAIPGADWNNRPNDIYFLTQYLSDEFEREINWQVISINDPVEMWRNAPVAYISTDKKLELDDAQKANLKRYIELGGTILLNSEGGNRVAARSFEQIMHELFPDYKARKLPPDHTLFTVHRKLERTEIPGITAVTAISNGAREIAVILEADYGKSLQMDDPPQPNKAAWAVVTNFFVMVTDRRTLNNRLVDAYEKRQKGNAAGTVTIGRAQYDGPWNVEPAAFETLSNHLFNRTKLDLKLQEVALADIKDSELGLIVMTGINDVTLKDEELAAIEAYIRSGGTIFVESVGGNGNFAEATLGQIESRLKTIAVPLDASDHPIVTGKTLTGGYDNRTAGYTRYTVTRISVGSRLRLKAIFIDDRPVAIFSNEDLSLALLNVRHWGILGYDHETARSIMTNLILATKSRPASDDAPDA